MSKITLGLRSSAGRRRLQVGATATGSTLRNAIQKELAIEEDFEVRLDSNGRPGDEVKLTRTSTMRSLKLHNGDVLYITPVAGTRFKSNDDEDDEGGGGSVKNGGSLSAAASSASLSSLGSATAGGGGIAGAKGVPPPELDAVDETLRKKDGRIEVAGTSKGPGIFKEPFDEAYLREEGIKHMSFHSYLRKLSSGMSKGKYVALENISCKIRPNCRFCPKPWPAGICSKCQPPALTLNRQPYRHVDNVMFENPAIVDRFLAFWRNTGSQRIGILYGRYEEFEDVPLGIKAVVSAIYEPPQDCSRDGIKLIQDDQEDVVESLAKELGLKKVGWVFTDLVQDSKGNIRNFRNIDTHFLSAQECIMAGYFQNQHPNACRQSSSGAFGSKFATVLISGDQQKQIHMEGYQVSNQCMALVRDNCLIPTKDAPELGYVRESSTKQYVPDVFFKEKDKYGNEVTKIARPLPVEYLLIDVPVATPKKPIATFHTTASVTDAFPVENRPMEGHLQDFGALASYRKLFQQEAPADFFRDFHLLIYLATQTVNPLGDYMKPLLEAVRDNKEDAIVAWANSEHWRTIELLLEAHNGGFQ